MSKKIFIINIILVAAIVLASCTTFSPATEIPATQQTDVPAASEIALSQSTQPVETGEVLEAADPAAGSSASLGAEDMTGTITVWHAWNEFEMESLAEVMAAFQEQFPQVQFDVLYVPFDDLRRKVEAASLTGGGPTVLIGPGDWGPALFDAARATDLSGQVREDLVDTINPAARSAVEYKGSLIGLPHEINKGVVLYRNATIIPDAVTTWADFLESAQAATQGDVVGADLDTGVYNSAAHLNACGGKLMDENGEPAFNNDAGVCWLNLFKEYDETGLPSENDNDNDVNLFEAGKAGMIVDGTWNLTRLAEAIGAENLSIDPWPDTDEGTLSGYLQTENLYLGVNATGDDLAASLAFMEFFLSPEAQAILAEPTKANHIPSVVGVNITDPLMRQAVLAFKEATAFPVIADMNAYWEPVNSAILAVTRDGIDPVDALQVAEDEVKAKLEEIRGGDQNTP